MDNAHQHAPAELSRLGPSVTHCALVLTCTRGPRITTCTLQIAPLTHARARGGQTHAVPPPAAQRAHIAHGRYGRVKARELERGIEIVPDAVVLQHALDGALGLCPGRHVTADARTGGGGPPIVEARIVILLAVDAQTITVVSLADQPVRCDRIAVNSIRRLELDVHAQLAGMRHPH
eukprot:7243401-Prymnesium_polylepis.1